MKSPFITLTKVSSKVPVQININHIVAYQERSFSDIPQKKYTYILVNNSAHASLSVLESYEHVSKLIQKIVNSNQ